MDSSKLLRKYQRALLTRLRECCIFSVPLTLMYGGKSYQITPQALDDQSPRDLERERMIRFTLPSEASHRTDAESVDFLIVDLKETFLRLPLIIRPLNANCLTGAFQLQEAEPSNRRKEARRKEHLTYFVPVMLYTSEPQQHPIPGYARIIDSDSIALCVHLQFFQKIGPMAFDGARLLFQDAPLGVHQREQPILRIRNLQYAEQVSTQITRLDAILGASNFEDKRNYHLAAVQPLQPLTVEFKCLLHDGKSIRANLVELLAEGFFLAVSAHEFESVPSHFQADHTGTGIRFNFSKLGNKLFVSYRSLSLGSKTVWFNFITRYALGYDHCFTPADAQKILHLMLESGNYTSPALLELSLLHDYFQHKWPIETSFSPTKYRWLVRDRHGDYIGHTAAVRVSESLWGAIDNIGSQSYSGSWNAEFVARWIRSLADLLSGTGDPSWIQWTFVPAAGVWTRFDNMISSEPKLARTRDRFWGVFLLNRSRCGASPRKHYKVETIENINDISLDILSRLPDSQRELIRLLNDGLDGNLSFQLDFEREYGFQLRRHFRLITSSGRDRFLLTFTNYPAWATLHKGHNWDYLFPLDPITKIEQENELLDLVEETIFLAGCTPYRLALVSPSLSLSTGVEWTNLSLHPDALEYAARSLEKL